MGESRREQIFESEYTVDRIEDHLLRFSTSNHGDRCTAGLSKDLAARIGARIGDRVVTRTTVEVVRCGTAASPGPEPCHDAVILLAHWLRDRSIDLQLDAFGIPAEPVFLRLCDIAEPLLGVDRSAGERAYVRVQDGTWIFITKDPMDTLFFADGTPRYEWTDGPDGIRRGRLLHPIDPPGPEPEAGGRKINFREFL